MISLALNEHKEPNNQKTKTVPKVWATVYAILKSMHASHKHLGFKLVQSLNEIEGTDHSESKNSHKEGIVMKF